MDAEAASQQPPTGGVRRDRVGAKTAHQSRATRDARDVFAFGRGKKFARTHAREIRGEARKKIVPHDDGRFSFLIVVGFARTNVPLIK